MRHTVQTQSGLPASDSKPVFLCGWLPLLLLIACADDDPRTRFGSLDDVGRYRAALNPIIESVSEIEADVQETAVGASGAATAANLAAVYERVLPALEATRETYEHISPPRHLSNLHRLIGDLIDLRIAAYSLVVRGFAAGDEALYDEAEQMLTAANELIVEINGLLRSVDAELAGAASKRRPLAAAGHNREEFY